MWPARDVDYQSCLWRHLLILVCCVVCQLGVMMRQLGQSPTEAELVELIKSVDDDGMDGKIQLREFLTLYTRGLDTKDKPGMVDVNNAFAALGGDVRDMASTIKHEHVQEQMLAEYGLNVRGSLPTRALQPMWHTYVPRRCPRARFTCARLHRRSTC